MIDELDRCYELLGVKAGASVQELKTAHRDLAKVWHPDRFAHDPRLQQKAQEKLKEINEAFDQIMAEKAGRRSRASASANPSEKTRQSPSPAVPARRTRWQLILPAVLVFAAIFFAASRALISSGGQKSSEAVTTPAEQAQTGAQRQQTGVEAEAQAAGAARGRRADQPPAQPSAREATTGNAIAPEQDTTRMRRLPTVTLTIDPVTGMIARPDCPIKSSMTYPAGAEPKQYCSAQHKTEKPAESVEGTRPKESRLKSLTRRLAAPAKLFGGRDHANR
ncbi:MAG TPA: J domain-containing protein [Pyrinomonadaceae bacterium]|nr:J domain-containing protein [Pyrinomonadaceae bacterium]